MTHTGKSAGQHNDSNDKDVMGYALPRREHEPVPVGLAVRDSQRVTNADTLPHRHMGPDIQHGVRWLATTSR
jgi:hypothetical protein